MGREASKMGVNRGRGGMELMEKGRRNTARNSKVGERMHITYWVSKSGYLQDRAATKILGEETGIEGGTHEDLAERQDRQI